MFFEATGNEMPQESLELTIPRLTLGASRAVMLNQNFTLTPEINATFLFGGKTNELIASDIRQYITTWRF